MKHIETITELAVQLAADLRDTEVRPDHLWVALVNSDGEFLQYLRNLGVDIEDLVHEAARALKPSVANFRDPFKEPNNSPPSLSRAARDVINEVASRRGCQGHSDDLLLALLMDRHGLAMHQIWCTTGREIAKRDVVLHKINPELVPEYSAAA